MIQWFKCLSPDDPLMEDIFKTFGIEGYGYACVVMNQAFLQKVYTIDTERLSRWLNIRTPKAQKLLPFFQKLLSDYERITEQSDRKPKQSERITEQSEQITPVTTPSNPHGSTRDQEKNREEENRVDTPLTPQGDGCESAEFKNSVQLACSYAASSLANQTTHWVSPYLKGFYYFNRSKWQALTDADIATCWEKACKSWDKGKPYVQKVFERELSEFTPDKRPAMPVSKPIKNGNDHTLRHVPKIYYEFDDRIYLNEELSFKSDGVFLGEVRLMPALLYDAEEIGRA
mgnify:CR=1 FL=1